MNKLFLMFLLSFNILVTSIPQECRGQTTSTATTGVRRSMAIVMFAGLAGAVLGASTLSFYGEPQEHISNIWTGLAAGTLIGGIYVVSQGPRASIALEQPRPTNPYQIVKLSQPLFQYQLEF